MSYIVWQTVIIKVQALNTILEEICFIDLSFIKFDLQLCREFQLTKWTLSSYLKLQLSITKANIYVTCLSPLTICKEEPRIECTKDDLNDNRSINVLTYRINFAWFQSALICSHQYFLLTLCTPTIPSLSSYEFYTYVPNFFSREAKF